ncbi:MAG: hypothetical protein IH984_04370 [Planctomycetes bacterium]|nr:hypothetical protein [Planctomycetota bacterium]
MKRVVLVNLLSLILGMGATVSSAWLAFLLPREVIVLNDSYLVWEQSKSWALYSCRRIGEWHWTAIHYSYDSSAAIHISDVTIPKWSRLRDLPDYKARDPIPTMLDFGYGWPFISMSFSFEIQRDWLTGTVISQEVTGTFGSLNLPVKVNTWGFVGDVFFFAILFLLSLVAVIGTRRRWRIQKGKCPICCYNLRSEFSTGCPECGWGREAEV